MKKGFQAPPPNPLPETRLKTYVDEGFKRRPKPPRTPLPERSPKPLLDLGGGRFQAPPRNPLPEKGFQSLPENPPLPKHG